MFLVPSCICFCQINRSQMLSRKWRWFNALCKDFLLVEHLNNHSLFIAHLCHRFLYYRDQSLLVLFRWFWYRFCHQCHINWHIAVIVCRVHELNYECFVLTSSICICICFVQDYLDMRGSQPTFNFHIPSPCEVKTLMMKIWRYLQGGASKH